MIGVRLLRRGRDQGFTLVEVLLVTAVIGVLLAIAIPSFLGSKSRVQDRSAQANLRIAFTNAKTLYADTDSFAKVTSTVQSRGIVSSTCLPPDQPLSSGFPLASVTA